MSQQNNNPVTPTTNSEQDKPCFSNKEFAALATSFLLIGAGLGVLGTATYFAEKESNTYAIKLSDEEVALRKSGLLCDEALTAMFQEAISIPAKLGRSATIYTKNSEGTADLVQQCRALKNR